MHDNQNDKNIATFFRTGHPIKFSKGEVVIGSDDRPQGIYYIDTGYVQVYSITNKGEKVLHVIYKHGEVFPFVWAYLGVNADVYFEALSELLVWRVTREQYVLFAKESNVISYALTTQMARQFALYNSRIENLLLKHSRERVIHRLVYLSDRFGVVQDGAIRINIPMTHEIIGASVNLSRESVSREMEKLERESLVMRVNHQIIIRDLQKLNSQLTTPINLELLDPRILV